jgi:hypothetical protein
MRYQDFYLRSILLYVIGQLGRKALARSASFFVLERHPVLMVFVAHRSSGLIMSLVRRITCRALSVMHTGLAIELKSLHCFR